MAELILYPAANGDDCCWSIGQPNLNNALWLAVGHDTNGYPCGSYLRFPSCTIPQGATITSAVLTLYADANTAGTDARVKIYCNDVYTSVAPTSGTEGDALVLTTANVEHIYTAWLTGNPYDSPDIKTCIQEVVDRGDWVNGNAIAIVVRDNGGSNHPKYLYAYDDGNAAYYPKLVINYSTTGNRNVNATLNLASAIKMQGSLMNGDPGDMTASLPVAISMGGTITVVPRPTLNGILTIPISIRGTINAPQYYICTGAFDIPEIEVDGIGSENASGEASISVPSLTASCYGYIDILGDGAFDIPPLSLSATGIVKVIGTADFNLAKITLSTVAWTYVTGTASLIIPLIDVDGGRIITGSIGTFECKFPLFTLSPSTTKFISGQATVNLPVISLDTATTPLTATYLCMVMNIKNRALTLFDNYDFNSLCRFNDKHYGATSSNIYDLDAGDTDVGTIIDWNFRTGYIDLEQKLKKKLKQAWLSYKSDGDIILTVIQPDGQEWEYEVHGVYEYETGIKIKVGKGIRHKYVKLDIKGVNGSDITLDTIKLHYDQFSSRR